MGRKGGQLARQTEAESLSVEIIDAEIIDTPQNNVRSTGRTPAKTYYTYGTRNRRSIPLYTVAADEGGSVWFAFRLLLSSIRWRSAGAVMEILQVIAVSLFCASFGLNMFRTEPVSLTGGFWFDPTALGANFAMFVRPILGYTAGAIHDQQIRTMSDPNNESRRAIIRDVRVQFLDEEGNPQQ